MNHRRQENTLNSYAALMDGLNKYDPDHDTVLSICEWGKHSLRIGDIKLETHGEY